MAALYQPFPMQPGHRAQVWRHQPAYRRPRHFHYEPELNLVFGGHARMGVGHLELEMTRGDVLLLRPGQDHELLSASDDLDLFVVALTPPLAERCLRGPWPVDSRPFRLPEAEIARLRDELGASRENASREASELRVTELFVACSGQLGWGHPVSRKAFQATTDTPTHSAGSLARRFRVHPSELGRHFQRDLGLPFVEFRTRLRLMQFIARVDGGASLTRAAGLASFGSYTQCHRTFQRYLGCSPRDYFAGLRRSLDDTFEPDGLPDEQPAAAAQ
jgi:AraC-like DNA-binding protein